MRQSNTYIIIFTLITTVFVGGTLAVTSILLGPRQALSIEYDTKSQILGAVMNITEKDDVLGIYDNRIKSLVVNYQGEEVKTDAKGQPLVAEKVDVAKNYKLKPEERLFPVFKYVSAEDPNKIDAFILPVYGNGLWDRIWGFMALDNQLETVKGISFGHKAETPGLGARISDDPIISQRYEGKKIYNEQGKLVSVDMVKGEKGEPLDAHHVDGMSGATMTGNGVNKMLMEYLNCYESYFKKVKAQNVAGL
ncbi:MAG TPA: NADH:ubiquinone reductase (Na(+)-transporting) subunit C [Cytophagales bacterium]|nr:NADH:ubiquinone reductase (Na(+)-transporting) subunit C [Cytophagales bacterium]HCR53314.1 NADH:ubiquinone reductase (Na(+)-transporting) subunit C [Cytophagales bacterium]